MSTYQSQFVSPADEPDVKRARLRRRRRTTVLVAVAAAALCGAGSIIAALGGGGDSSRVGAAAASAVATKTPATTPAKAAEAPTKENPAPAMAADKKYTGRGDKVLKLQLEPNRIYIARITHRGSSNFIVRPVVDGEEGVALVNEIGRYSGIRPLGLDDEHVTALKIEADGRWTITVQDVLKAPKWDGAKASGTGDSVLVATSTELPSSAVKVTHSGGANFAVKAYDESGYPDLLVNEIGRYSGEVLMPKHVLLVDVIADGKWAIAAS